MAATSRPIDRGDVTPQVMVLNGGSSAGKSSIVRCLQALLPELWLSTGMDVLLQSMPASLHGSPSGLEFTPDGRATVGKAFRELQRAWIHGVAATARAGARVIVDDVFLDGAACQERWQEALEGLRVLWVGVRCDGAVAACREVARGDRVSGLARSQADAVHRGVTYHLTLDTAGTESMDCARLITRHLA
ncbi:chloramphenicol phosphotransferase CPT [Streptomyces sp. NPDC046977]|uniref:chloramphenicol phosphotransferase CPT n=1 Tax=Streptomyces sp. NPDC046977 TaxID=3154703 RepID=UPI0033D824DE